MAKNTKNHIVLKGRIRTYLNFTIYLGILLCAVSVAVCLINYLAGCIVALFTLFYLGITLYLNFYNKPLIMNELISFATEYGQIQKKLLKELEIPYCLLDDGGKIMWMNTAFGNTIHQPKGYNKTLSTIFPSMTKDKIPNDHGVNEAKYELSYEDREYEIFFRKISLKEMAENSDMLDAEDYNGFLIAVYLFDKTGEKMAIREADDQSLAVGLIYMDNYDEAMESVEDVRRSLLTALIERKINKYISSYDGIAKKIEKDKLL